MAFQARTATVAKYRTNLYEDVTFRGDSAIGNIQLKRKPVWIRANDLCENAMFVVDGATSHDLDQGALGNCWFIAAAATLAATNKPLFERVVPLDQEFGDKYNGKFRFNFWWCDEWTEVVVDDYLPTFSNKLVFCSNRERRNEFWPALLEKAYAKLNESYAALDGGKIYEAMKHLTGGSPEVINITRNCTIRPNLYDRLLAAHRRKSLIGASIHKLEVSTEAIRKGLIAGHAYSVTGFQQLPQPDRTCINLLRLRNPWGRGEWKGAWSDGSVEMRRLPKMTKRVMKFKQLDDGEFWIEFSDVLRNFHEIQLCHFEKDAFVERTSLRGVIVDQTYIQKRTTIPSKALLLAYPILFKVDLEHDLYCFGPGPDTALCSLLDLKQWKNKNMLWPRWPNG